MTGIRLPSSGQALGAQLERFEIVRLLGEGGMGVVHEAIDRSTGRRVALKTLRDLDTDSRLRFKREFRALQGVSHARLVRLHELFEVDGRLFFSMDLVEGVDFLEFVRRRKQAEPEAGSGVALPGAELQLLELRRALAQLVEAVDALHQNGLIHRDIKPSNILVDARGSLHLLDFGLVTGENADRSTGRHFVGTAAYMAPEQALGEVCFETDWYAVGVLLFQALTGALPFDGSAVFMVTNKVAHDAPKASSVAREVPEDLDALCAALLHRDPQRRGGARAMLDAARRFVKAAPDTPSRFPPASLGFVGRETERAWLFERFQGMADGKTVTACIHGESGIGKTALVRQFLRDIAEHSAPIVLSGRCYERESIHYKGIDGVVDSLVLFLRGLPTEDAALFAPRHVAELIRQFPAFGVLAPFARASQALRSSDPQQARAHGILALRELLVRVSDRYRVVVYVDDLQWIDADGEAVLQETLRPPDAPRLLLITTTATARDDRSTLSRLELLRPSEADMLRIEALSAEDAGAMVDDYAARQQLHLTADERASLVSEAEGSPILLSELLRHALGTSIDPVSAPRRHGLSDVLGQRVAALPEVARRLLELACVAEMQLSRQLARGALQLDDAGLNDAVEQLTAQRFLITLSGNQQITLLQPSHDRVRRLVLGGLQKDELCALHRVLAQTLEASGSPDVEALAMDWSRAGEPARAAPYAALAGHAAAATFAFDRACALFRLALSGNSDPNQCRELQAALGEALANAGRGVEAARAFADAAELSQVAAEQADLRRRAADQLLHSGHIDEGVEAMRAVLAPLGGGIAKTPRRALISLLYHRGRLALRGLNHRPRSEASIPAETLHRLDVYWAVSNGLSLVDVIRGVDFQTRCLILALDAGEPNRLAQCLTIEAVVAASEGPRGRERAPELFARAEALARESGRRDIWARLLLSRGIAAIQEGRFQACLEATVEAERILLEECHGAFWELARARSFMIWSLAYLGRLREMERLMAPLLHDYRERGDLTGQLAILSGPSHVSGLARGQAPAMLRDCELVLAQWSQSGFHFQHMSALFTFAVGELYEGAYARASQRVESSWRQLEESFLLRIEFVRSDSWYLRGRTALAAAFADAAQRTRGVEVVRRAVRKLEGDAVAWARGFALALRAGLAELAGDDELSARLLGRAELAFQDAGMRLYAAACALQGAGREGHAGRLALELLQEEGVEEPLRFASALVPTRRPVVEQAASSRASAFQAE